MAIVRIKDKTPATATVIGDVLPIDSAPDGLRSITPENLLKENLVALKGLTTAADKMTYWSGAGAAALADAPAFGRSVLASADAAAARTTLGVVIGTNVQTQRTITGTANQIDVSNGDGVSGNPTLSIPSNAALPGAPTTTTASPNDNSTKIATTAYVDAQVAGGVAGVASIDSLTGGFTTDDSISATSNVIRAQFAGHIYGLTLSNNASDTTNDIDIAAGEAADDTNAILIKLTSPLTKRLDAAWAVGSGNGWLDTGSIANGFYHVFLIQRSDTGVVDSLASTSPTAPTMPPNYDRKRRIGAILRSGGGAIRPFFQNGDLFRYATPVNDVVNQTQGTSRTTRAFTVPTGIRVQLLFYAWGRNTSSSVGFRFTSLDEDTGQTPYSLIGAATNQLAAGEFLKLTNTAGEIGSIADTASSNLWMSTLGWYDARGR